MAFKMNFSKEQLEGIQPVPAGIYSVLFIKFAPKKSKNANNITGLYSTNLNAQVKILGHPEFETDRFLFASLNEGIPSFIQDFVHSFGLDMEEDGIPGGFEGDPNEPSTWVYSGPLTSKTAQWEVGVGEYQGKPNNVIRQFICSVPNCAEKNPKIRHSADMARKG